MRNTFKTYFFYLNISKKKLSQKKTHFRIKGGPWAWRSSSSSSSRSSSRTLHPLFLIEDSYLGTRNHEYYQYYFFVILCNLQIIFIFVFVPQKVFASLELVVNYCLKKFLTHDWIYQKILQHFQCIQFHLWELCTYLLSTCS